MSTRRQPIHRYSESALNAALKAIIDDIMPIRTASVTFGVPRATIGSMSETVLKEVPVGSNCKLFAHSSNFLMLFFYF